MSIKIVNNILTLEIKKKVDFPNGFERWQHVFKFLKSTLEQMFH